MPKISETQEVVCPRCGKKFPLNDAIVGPLRGQLREELEHEYDDKLSAEKKKLQEVAISKAQQQAATEVKDLKNQIDELTTDLKASKDNELKLRKEHRALEKRQEEMELEITKKVDQQVEEAKNELSKGYSIKDRQHQEQIAALTRQIDDLKRKAEQGSQQSQGEALELELEAILGKAFPDDSVDPVPKGMKGADILQRVNGRFGECCGTIIWESKNTKNWSNGWLDKLRENQREIKAEIAVIATSVLPEGIKDFGVIGDVWVTHWSFASQLACALRLNLVELRRARVALEGKDQKMEILYSYLTGGQFRQRVETIAGAFKRMRDDLQQERDAMERIWNKREKQLETVIKGTAGMYGDIEGIAGAYLAPIEILQLPNGL